MQDAGLRHAGRVGWFYDLPRAERVDTLALLLARQTRRGAFWGTGLQASDLVHFAASVTGGAEAPAEGGPPRRPAAAGDLLSQVLADLDD